VRGRSLVEFSAIARSLRRVNRIYTHTPYAWCKLAIMAAQSRAQWVISPGYPDGWVVTVIGGKRSLSRYYGGRGGEWALDAKGVQGTQLAGTLDVRAPRDRAKFGRWVRKRLAEEVAELNYAF
jgi:hypothetical protein